MRLHTIDLAVIILGLTFLYAIKGGMISVVLYSPRSGADVKADAGSGNRDLELEITE